jgi:lactate dehydrogenase-like 2-hydroxyacid dehydrogenase
LIAFLGAGYQSFIDVEAASQNGVAVTSTPGVNAHAVAELTVAHILNSRRQLTALNTATKRGRFPRTVTREVGGARTGIIGLGAVGTATARMLVAGLGAEVVYHSRTRKPEVERELGIAALPLEELLTTSEIVVLLLTAGPETVGYLGAGQIALMRADAILVNTARASLVDGHALRRALQTGAITAAAFDGYYTEPVPAPEHDDYGLLGLPDHQFVVTPHVGALTRDANARMAEMVLSSVLTFSRTGDDAYVANPEFRRAPRRATASRIDG